MRYRPLRLTTRTNELSCNRSSPIGRDRALRCGCTAHSLVQQPRPLWPKQTSPYAFSITSFQFLAFSPVRMNVPLHSWSTLELFFGRCGSARTKICSFMPKICLSLPTTEKAPAIDGRLVQSAFFGHGQQGLVYLRQIFVR